MRRRERIERGSVLIAIIAIHLLLLLWLVTRPPSVPADRDRGRSLTLISLSTGANAATPPTKTKPPPPIVIPVRAIIMPSLLPTPPAALNPLPAGRGAPQAGDAGGCALAVRTAESIAGDPRAMAELAALPPAYRTSADAVMLWNGQWLATAPGSVAPPATASLRRVVVLDRINFIYPLMNYTIISGGKSFNILGYLVKEKRCVPTGTKIHTNS